ncbi:DUF6090 family protein [Robiginitalea sp. SC105]|uniref:DUF6090 family protein n=1 Tax=Robiginitalea sp. SC105 TaxID=2762332 RepID=UPI001639BED4|nr:DUF6090 family protein [Robiginitalea sp. SC105]MBC2839857.1 hypothetical protein [Robiginitalea sp. SC105]
MLRFFRTLRQKLLTENQFSKYLLYAIGEILLVVIGILIALQIDNWNEKRITKQREIKYITELNHNLKRNLRQFESFSSAQKELIHNMSKLIEYNRNGLKYHDSLGSYFRGISWLEQANLVTSSYQTMKATGLDIISSDSLRLKIVDLHEVQYGQYIDLVKDVGLSLYNTRVQPLSRKYHDLAMRFENRDYIDFLEDRIIWKKDLVMITDDLKKETELLIDQINAELD